VRKSRHSGLEHAERIYPQHVSSLDVTLDRELCVGRTEEELEAQLSALQAEASELAKIIEAEQQVSDENIKRRTEETEEVERRTQVQRDTMRADIIQAEACFKKEEM